MREPTDRPTKAAIASVLDGATWQRSRTHFMRNLLIQAISAQQLDRMRASRLPGYTRDEQVTVAQTHLVRRRLARLAITN